jgi:DNA helicase-2/ATP-dependent DNA helicase PcrA
LTVTRKAAAQMQERAGRLLGYAVGGLQGGTFHGFAYSILRKFPPDGMAGLTVMDAADISSAIQQCKERLHIGKGDRTFPKVQSVAGLISKARNKEAPLEAILRRKAAHLLVHADAMQRLAEAYAAYKREHGLFDFDDLLFELERALEQRPEVLEYCRNRFRYIMVDEYQDTNPVQARLVRLLAGEAGNVMAVGDDAQSIYAFRGADIRNILDFRKFFPGAHVIRLEENYRSTQRILDLANKISAGAAEGYHKHLFTKREGGGLPRLIRPLGDLSQAGLVAEMIQDSLLRRPPSEIAVLFRAGFHSYNLEVQLSKRNVPFRKYGGVKYIEAAHVKDVLSFARLAVNPLDLPAFQRLAGLHRGVGPKTADRIYALARTGEAASLALALAKHQGWGADLAFLDAVRADPPGPEQLLSRIITHYAPRLAELYPEDWPRRQQGLDELVTIASAYVDTDLLLADLSLEDPGGREERGETVTLSTIHSAKGLEWDVVILLDLVEDRFPSRHSLYRPDDFEEERRLMYVACTRARDELVLCVPASIYNRGDGVHAPAIPSPFVRELGPELYEEWKEGYGRGLLREAPAPAAPPIPPSPPLSPAPAQCGYCTHKIFGRGKIIQILPPDKYRVNFPGFGPKVILAAYLCLEEAAPASRDST